MSVTRIAWLVTVLVALLTGFLLLLGGYNGYAALGLAVAIAAAINLLSPRSGTPTQRRPARGGGPRVSPLRVSLAEPLKQRPCGASAVADRVLLLVAQLRHRQALGPVLGQERRVIAKATLPARLGRELARAAPVEQPLIAARRVHVSDRADVFQPAARRRLAQQLRQVLLVRGLLARVARRAHARRPAKRRRRDARIVGDAHAPRHRCRRTCLAEGVLRERLTVLRRQLHLLRQHVQLPSLAAAGRLWQQPRQLAHLVLVVRRQQQLHAELLCSWPDTPAIARCWASCSRSMPAAASASSSSRCARESGVRSAVACTSIRPPSPVITTFASTS